MQYYNYVILSCCLSSILFAQDFPISAFQCNDIDWFKGAGEDSLGLNMIHYGAQGVDKTRLLAALDSAQEHGLKVIMNNATKDAEGMGDLRWYCQLHWGSWEAVRFPWVRSQCSRVSW